MPRVQVRDLAAPDPVQPSPLPSDTFAAPAQPEIDNNMERLASALGYFGAGVKSYLEDPARKKALRDSQLAEWETWKAARTSTEQLDAIRSGKAPYWADPYVNEVVRRYHGGLEADVLTDQLDNEIKGGTVPKFGTPNLDPEAYVVGKAAPFMQRVGRDASATVAFGGALDKVKEGFRKRHEEALGVVQTARMEDVARARLDDAVTNGIEDGLDAGRITDGLRFFYKELGPRVKGGSLDLKYARLDDLLIDVVEKKAKDPRYARQALQILGADRVGIDGETPIGPIASVARHSDRIEAIKGVALKTLSTEWENNVTAEIGKIDLQLLKQNDGEFTAQVRDLETPNRVDPSKTVKLSGEDRKKKAVEAFIAETRATHSPEEAFQIEMDTMVKNGVEHPEWVPRLKSIFVGIANTNVSKGVGPDQFERLHEAAQIYDRIANSNWTYLNQMLPKDARDFYELNSTLRRFMAANPAEAAQATAYAFSSEQANQDPKVLAGRLEDVRSRASRMDFSWLPFTGSISNGGEVQNHITDIAGALMRTGGVDVDTAIKAAQDRIKNNAVYINGRAIMSPGLIPGDAPHIQTILDDTFKAHETRFKSLGIDSPNELSVMPLRSGAFVVVRWNAGADLANGSGVLTVPDHIADNASGPHGRPKESPPRRMVISTAQISAARQTNQSKADKEAREDFTRANEVKRSITSFAPHNVIRKLTGSDPIN